MFSDHPIKNFKEDIFGRKHFARRIAEIIGQRTDEESIVIGLHAPWGEGKTSVLNLVEKGLAEHLKKGGKTLLDGHIVLLKFNPWRFSDENQLLENFFLTMADTLDGRIISKGEKLSDLVRNYSAVVAPLEIPKINIFGADVGLNLESTVKKLAGLKPKATVDTLKERIIQILQKSNKKIVIMIDDIDRLDKDEVQAIFRLVKLSADFPNTIYLLAFDVERVTEALKERFGGRKAAESFLEKIVQLSLPLPPLTTDKLIKLTFDRINELLKENSIDCERQG